MYVLDDYCLDSKWQ